jgi:NIPSNAP
MMKKLLLLLMLASCMTMLPGVARAEGRVFELRTYTSPDGKLGELEARFRDHTTRIFKKHNMEVVGYWRPEDGEKSKNTLVYILAFPSREAATQAWKDFAADPEWKKVAAETEANGKIVTKVESMFLDALPFSPMK